MKLGHSWKSAERIKNCENNPLALDTVAPGLQNPNTPESILSLSDNLIRDNGVAPIRGIAQAGSGKDRVFQIPLLLTHLGKPGVFLASTTGPFITIRAPGVLPLSGTASSPMRGPL